MWGGSASMALDRESRQVSSIRWGRPEMRSRLQEAGLALCTSSMALYTSYRLWDRPHSSSKSCRQHLSHTTSATSIRFFWGAEPHSRYSHLDTNGLQSAANREVLIAAPKVHMTCLMKSHMCSRGMSTNHSDHAPAAAIAGQYTVRGCHGDRRGADECTLRVMGAVACCRGDLQPDEEVYGYESAELDRERSHLLECLNANAESGESQAHVLPQALRIKGAGIRLHGHLSASCNPKPPVQRPDQALQLLRRYERGRAPAEVYGFEG